MREIKFRAWDKENEYMYYDVGLHPLNCKSCMTISSEGLYYNNSKPEHNHELMQYTGLKDKNGKEIYENDIIKRNNGNKYIVEWNKEHSKFELFRIKDRYPVDFMELSAWKEQVEIIGNIYENPELLK